jgi:hypothetical protein
MSAELLGTESIGFALDFLTDASSVRLASGALAASEPADVAVFSAFVRVWLPSQAPQVDVWSDAAADAPAWSPAGATASTWTPTVPTF